MLSHCSGVPAAGGQEVGRYHGSMLSRAGGWHLPLPQTRDRKKEKRRTIAERAESKRRRQRAGNEVEQVKIGQRELIRVGSVGEEESKEGTGK